MPTKLSSVDRRVIAAAILIAAASLAIGVKYFARVFPEAAIQFRVNRDDSTPIATKFLANRGWKVDGYRHAALFDYDDDAKVYLERTQGLAKMNALTRGPIHLWRWSHRWFKPQQKEEFRADVTPTGQVVGFDHEIEETAPGATLDAPAARAIADKFLTDVMKMDLTGLDFVESSSEKRPARTDFTFTYKEHDVHLGEGSYRLEVEVDGAQVSGYREYVKIPEDWTRGYRKLRSRNEAANVVDEVPWILLCIAGLAFLIQHLRRRDVPIQLSMSFGLVAAVLYFLGQLNVFSQAEFGYRTADSFPSFVGQYLVENLLVAMAFGAFIFLLLASTEPMYREAFPRFISIRRYFTWQGLRSRSFFIANVVGIAMTFFFFAYQSVFYLVANKLGAWAPADVPFSDLLNTRFPWVMVLFVGFFPAVSEEIQFRAFAIPFLRKYLKMGPFAVVLAAFIWGFLHSAYPNEPFFIRGLEVGFGGIIVGLVMLRFGIMATLIWHYSVDALYTAFLLLRSPNHYLMFSGALSAGIMVVPMLVMLVAYLKTGTFSDEENLLNAAEPVPAPLPAQAAETAEVLLTYQPLPRSRVTLAAVLTIAFAALAFVPVYRFGKGVVLRISSRDAVRIASDYLRQQNVDPDIYSKVAWVNNNIDPDALHYLTERKSVEQADKIYRQATRLALWEVRFFRPLQREEFQIFVDPDSGKIFGTEHVLPEDAPGASLTAGQARTLAEGAVRQHGYQLDEFDLQNSEAVKRPAREDYTLVWQAKTGGPRNVGDAHYRLEVDIAGDQVVGFSRSFKLPEEWERAQEAATVFNNVLSVVGILLALTLTAACLILFVNSVRFGAMPWKRSVKFGVALALLGVVGSINGLPLVYRSYDTSTPLTVWKVQVAAGLSVVPLLEGLLAWLIIGCALSYYPDGWKIFTPARRVWCRDAVLAAVLSVAAGFGLARINNLLVSVFHAHATVNDELFSITLATRWPAVGFFESVVTRTLFIAAFLAIISVAIRMGWKKRAWWLWPGLALVLISLGPAHAHSFDTYAVGWIMTFVPLLVAVLLVKFFLRDNLLAYVLVLFCLQLAQPLVSLFSQPNAFFLHQGVALAALGAIVVGWLLWTPGKLAAES